MKKRKLLLHKHLIGLYSFTLFIISQSLDLDCLDYKVDSESKNTSLSNVIKTTKNVLLSQDFPRKNQRNKNNNVLKSIITCHKEVQNPLSKILFNDDKYQLMKLFYDSFRDKLDGKEAFGYISTKNAVNLENYKELFKKTLDSDFYIFNSNQVKFSTHVLAFRGTTNHKNCNLLLNKKKIRWFLVNCNSGNKGFSKRLSQLIEYDDMDALIDEKISFLLLQPMLLVNDTLITKSFLIIY